MPRSRTVRRVLLGLVALVALGGAYLFFAPPRRPALLSDAARCRLGAYELPDGSVFSVRQREEESLRVIFLDGRSAAISPRGGEGRYLSAALAPGGQAPAMALEFARCSEGGEGSVRIALDGGETATSRRLRFDVKESAFRQGGVELVGRLLLPPGEGPVPIAVLVHGSERDSALDGEEWQFLLPARGVGAFVYDKRGTGRSGGVYTQDFDVLAADAVAAAGEARRLAGGRLAELGFFGGSQGGWIAPLAALRGGADFVVAAYGLAESPLAEDREEVLLGLREAGFDDEATRAKALEVVAATARIRASDFRDGFEELEAVKAQYRGEPWLAKVEGEFSGDLLRYPGWVLRLVGPRFDVGTSWEYEPLPTLEAIAVPHLWVLAGDDHDAPSAPTLAILRALQARRPNLDVALFPLADHGMLVPRRDAAGTVVAWSYAEGYQALILAWIQTKSLAGAAAGVQTWEGGAAG